MNFTEEARRYFQKNATQDYNAKVRALAALLAKAQDDGRREVGLNMGIVLLIVLGLMYALLGRTP